MVGLNNAVSLDIEEICNGGKVCLRFELPNFLPFLLLSSLLGTKNSHISFSSFWVITFPK
ncbi:hypothetical protein AtNW77_Chr2g0237481 [Arabidopsis thaliana]